LIRTILKCYEWRQLFRALKWHFRILKREGDWGMLASVLWWNLRHLPSTLIARAKIQKSRLCSDRQIFDRGLFETEDMAPPLDVVSCVDRLSTRTKPASSRVLMTGQLSAGSRLGEGWHLPECMFGQSVRWTNGPARACLQVNANECGRVRVELRLPQPLVKNRQITVSCNTVKESREVDAMPQSFVLPVVADAHGRLEILIEAPTWTPKQVESWNRDTRNLGCVVTEIRFESETSTNIWAPVSASLLITGRSQNLQNILTNLASEPCQPGEVFVIDKQESVPGSEPRTFPFRVEFLSNDRDDPTDSMLRALESVTGDVVIFLSAEHVVEPGFVKAHLDAQKAAGEPCVVLGACGLERRKIRSRPFQKWIGKRPSLTSADLSLANDGLFARLAGVNLSMARCLLEEHPVDPRFDVQGWSIFELCYRLSAHGIPFFTSAEARIRQAPNVKTWMIRMQTLGNQFALLQKVHPELRELILTELGQRPLPSWFRFLARPVHAGVWDWFDDLRLPLPSWFYRGVRDAAFLYGSEAPAKRLNKSSVLSRATE
jgi:hypothetical protein